MSTKPQLIEIVQGLLSDMEGDEVNSIADTLESIQIAAAVVTIYDNILDEHDLYTTKHAFTLDPSGTVDRPTHMALPADIYAVEWLKYDVRSSITAAEQWAVIPFTEPDEFLRRVDSRNSTDTTNNLVVTDPGGITIIIDIKSAPSYYTSFDGETIVFDSYDSDLDSTLVSAKTKAYGQIRVNTTQADATTIDLPAHLFTLLMNEAREFVFDLHKDGAPDKVRQLAHRSRVRTQRTRDQLKINRERENRNDYGRKSRT